MLMIQMMQGEDNEQAERDWRELYSCQVGPIGPGNAIQRVYWMVN